MGAAKFHQEFELWPKGVQTLARPLIGFLWGTISMTKKLFLAAASVAVLAFAGAAVAADLSVSVAGAPTVTGATAATDTYALADVVTSGELTGSLEVTVDYAAQLPVGNNLLLTFQLANGATFDGAVSIGDLTGFDQVTLSNGGTDGSNFVTFLVSSTAGTDTATLSTAIAFAAGARPTVALQTTTEFGTLIEGGIAKFGSANAATLIQYKPIVDISIEAGDRAVLALGSDPIFTAFLPILATDAVLGQVEVELNAVYVPNSAGELSSTLVTSAVVDGVDVDFTGNTTDRTITAAPVVLGVASDVTAEIDADADPLAASNYTATVTVDLDGFADVVKTGNLASIVREGVSAEVPWIASSALAAKNQTVSVIRVANTSTTEANVYVEVLTTASAQGLTPSAVAVGPQLAGVAAAGSDFQIGTAALTTLLGEFVRGNVLVTVEAEQEDITVNNRISYADGKVEETTVLPR